MELLSLRIETPRKQHVPVPHAVGSFHDHTPRARRCPCRNRIIRIVAGRNSEPTNTWRARKKGEGKRRTVAQVHHRNLPRGGSYTYTASPNPDDASRGTLYQKKNQRPLSKKKKKHQTYHAPRHFISNREYIPLGMEMFLETDTAQIADSQDSHVERKLGVAVGGPARLCVRRPCPDEGCGRHIPRNTRNTIALILHRG